MARTLALFVGLVAVLTTRVAGQGADFSLGTTDIRGDTQPPVVVQPQDPVSTSNKIIQRNTGINVAFGRSKVLEPETELKINVKPGDRCVVYVVSDPLSQIPGRLTPNRFPCDFGSGDVKYVHFGSRIPMRDRIKLQLRYDSETSTIIIPFMIDVTVESKQLEIVQKRVPLRVAALMGESDVLDGSKLEFAFDPSQTCKVTILSSASGWPRYGQVEGGAGRLGSMIDCDEFLALGITYLHTSLNDSPRMDHIPMVVELQDADGNVAQQEYFQVDIRIDGGAENNPPSFSNSVMMVLELNQFIMTAITPDVIAAEDIETDADKLVFNITVPLGPGEGYITSTDDRTLPISSFTQKDVRDLKIAYVPPAEDSNEQRIFQFELEVVDAELATSEQNAVMIVVNPKNTMAPVATRNAGLTIFEGQVRPILPDQNLQISDENNLWDVVIAPIRGPSHGVLRVNLQPRKFFTTDELMAGVVTYHHDGSETYSDNIIFRMNDGKNETEFLFSIVTAPVDDQPPIVDVNTGILIQEKELKGIINTILSATDVDSDDSTIRFILEQPYSTQGNMTIRQDVLPADPQNWQLSGGFYERVVTEWTLDDILSGRLFYRQNGDHNSDVVMDRILFRVADSGPNLSPVNEFVVKILPVDDQPPYLYPGTDLQMAVDEFAVTIIKKGDLRYTDQDSEDRNLYYTITDQPRDRDPNNPLPAGQIVLVEDPDTAVTNFYQSQINHLKIAYKPPGIELGITPRLVQFVFSVKDENGNLVSGQNFNIFLNPVDNKPPSVTNTGVSVSEGGEIVFDLSMLDAYDTDTDSSELIFNINVIPNYGNIMIDGVPMQPGDTFTLDDIARGGVTYTNNGAEEFGDTIELELTDGIHTVPVVIQVNVNPVDDEAPTLDLPPGTLGSFLEVPEQSSSLITNNILSASDPDTEDLRLTFIVDRFPQDGILENNGIPTASFSQQDIVNGYIRYRHTGGEIGLTKREDSFNLTLSDMSDKWVKDNTVITQIEVFVTILPVDNLAPNVTVGDLFDVDEGEKATITLNHLSATDIDSVDDDIVCTVVVQTTNGYIENISPSPGSEKSRAGIAISAFSVKDLRLNHINYVQSMHKGLEPQEDQFTFACSDGINVANTYFFPIEINPVNDEEPQIFVREIVVEEGGMIKIDPVVLNGVDEDIPDDELHFHIIVKPVNGDLIQSRADTIIPVKNFTLEQLRSGVDIFYKHDGSETNSDSFTVTLTDGVHEVSAVVNVIVLPADDETPRLSVNDGLDIKISDIRIITNRILQATDLDSPDSNLTFVVRLEPRNGLLQRLNKIDGTVLENITLGMNFTQWEIDNQRIRYVHTGTEGGRDLIKFDVTDGTNPLIDRYFYVNVDYVDNVHPDVVNAGVTLQEGGRVTLTTDILSTNDINSPDEDLVFTIAEGPIKGHLESTDNPGVPITTFTQLDLAGNKIYYVHTQDDEMKMDSFQFEVADGFNTVVRTFRISLSEVDNKKPVVTFTKLTMKEGDNKLITPFELRIDDTDTRDPLKLKFTITQLPVHGNLLRDNSEIVTMFTMDDLNENRISYQHDGTESDSDSFSFIVTDGTHTDFAVSPNLDEFTRTPQKMKIKILPVDNGMPQIVVNRGAPTLNTLGSGHLGFLITNKFIRAEDRDSDDGGLIYTISTYPRYGYIMNLGLGNISISNFTQDDVDNMRIQYVVYPNTNATSDIFFVNVQDPGGNVLANQPFRLNWSWISLDREYYEVNETDRSVEIKLLRRGYLGETSFVGIKAVDGTAVLTEDFRGKSATQVQFNPGQEMGFWRVRIINDDLYEQSEVFEVILYDAVMGALEYPERALVKILDGEDESTVFIDTVTPYIINEDIGEVLIPIRRTGDLSEEMMVLCSTMPGTATGADPSPVHSFNDYISRLEEDQDNFVRFDKDEDLAYCRILIIDDSLYEDAEDFQVKLTMPMGGRVGTPGQIDVVIAADASDEPSFYFGEPEYHIDESDGYLEIQVWRTGTDLSKMASVTVRSRASTPPSAVAGIDYAGISRNLDFAPGVTMQNVRVYIMDDLGQPILEGPETFELVLRMPMNAVLGAPSLSVVTINDTISDLPKVQFRDLTYEVNENDGTITTTIIRSGDLSITSTVRCYTRQGSAQVMMDFDERPNIEASIITFLPGERQKECSVLLMNDNEFEVDEQFRLVLGNARTDSGLLAMIGEQNETTITVHDVGDRSVIKFPTTRFNVNEPLSEDDVSTVRIEVIRMGDLSQTSVVRVFTKDGSAKSGVDYNPLSQQLEFGFNVSELFVDIDVLADGDRNEMREAFTVHLTMDEMMIAEIQMNKAIVYIEQEGQLSGVTFPSTPIVVSLLDYDNVEVARELPPRGYPVVCVTPCNPKHPEYATTGSICTNEGVNDTMTEFRWLVSAPTTDRGVTYPLRSVESNTFFTSTDMITLDSVYFGPGSRVQCVARAVSNLGDPGRQHYSLPTTISTEEGICLPRQTDAIGAEPYAAKLRYTGPGDQEHPNKLKLTVTMPHVDGMLPVISTRELSNFELALSKDGYRVGTHRCSNLLDFNEIPTEYGFITSETKNANVIGESQPYQFSSEMRGASSLRFYRNLDLEACLWEFTTYYDMSELLDECGGQVGTDGQVLDLIQSYVTLRVPLYVSNVFHSPASVGGWQHFDQMSNLQLTFVYDTSILWQNGVGAQDVSDTNVQGALFPTSMRINENGRLVVNFRTDALFRGLFVLDHPSIDATSSVISNDRPDLTFSLNLVRSEPTFAQPEQLWQFVSDVAVSDYSGSYTIRLIPCTTSPTQEYSLPVVCNPRDIINFELPLRFQQVSDPVPAEFSLNTQFMLLGKEMLWLSDGSMGFGEGTDTAFSPGDTVYGRIHVDPVQNLGSGFNLNVEKVFLCTGRDGYIPKYNPSNGEYGCVADSPNLLYAFKVLDRGAPDTITPRFNGVPFNAALAIDDPNALDLVRQSGADGFRLSSDPLFQVATGRQWYVHSIFTVKSQDNNNIGKRSVEHHSVASAAGRQRRQAIGSITDDVSILDDIGTDKGTNIKWLALNTNPASSNDVDDINLGSNANKGKNPEGNSSMVVPVAAIAAVLAVLLVAIVVVVLVRRKRSDGGPVTVVANGSTKVVSSGYGDNTEV